VTGPDGSHLWTVPSGETWSAAVTGNGFTLSSRGWSSKLLEAVTVAPAQSNTPIQVNSKSYRGSATLLRDGAGITVINRVGLESYLQGVISAEMGRRSPAEREALQAQAIVSRTFALHHLGRRKAKGFDLSAGMNDQVYSGFGAETPEGRAAVNATRGRVLTYEGVPIEAFYYSTCGGRTADGAEVFGGAAKPYLRSVSDEADEGGAYCSISPRYRWHEEWTGEALRTMLQRNLPAVAGVRSADIQEITGVRVTRRSSSGRVEQLAIGLGRSEINVQGQAIRQVMRLSSGEPLRSTAFNVVATMGAQRVTHLAVDGMGAGHGVGFCQWGAVGRARAGQGYQQILAAYFPGTRLERRY
jgi:stage II sporulation protein D